MQKSIFFNEVRESAVRIAKVQENHLAASIGSGTGFITEELIKAGLKVIAVDLSVEMINIMKTRFAGNTNIDLRVGNAESLPINHESVDYVFVCKHVFTSCLRSFGGNY